jgi:hypothetical protein
MNALIRRGETAGNDTPHCVRYPTQVTTSQGLAIASQFNPTIAAWGMPHFRRYLILYRNISNLTKLRHILGFDRALVPTRHWLGKPPTRAHRRFHRRTTVDAGDIS